MSLLLALARACAINAVTPVDDERLTEHLVSCASELGLDAPAAGLITTVSSIVASSANAVDAGVSDAGFAAAVAGEVGGRRLHSSTFRLNVSAFDGIGGAFRGCLGGG